MASEMFFVVKAVRMGAGQGATIQTVTWNYNPPKIMKEGDPPDYAVEKGPISGKKGVFRFEVADMIATNDSDAGVAAFLASTEGQGWLADAEDYATFKIRPRPLE